MSKVVVKVYPDRSNREECSIIPCDTFTDVTYFGIKDKYEEFEEGGFNVKEEDADDLGETFGWNLSDSWHEIGSVYVFLISLYNLIDTPKDESPIIDSKGMKNGSQHYSIQLEILDHDKTTPLNILEYETLHELIGKHLKVKFNLKRATEIPEKYTYKTMARYEWLDAERTTFETQVIEKRTQPDFAYTGEHIERITEDLCDHMREHSLQVKVMGMIESKKKKAKKQDAYASEYQSEAQDEVIENMSAAEVAAAEKAGTVIKRGNTIVKNPAMNDRLSELEKKNEELLMQLEAARRANTNKASCCTIF